MKIGTRIVFPEEVGHYKADILQISVYNGMKDNLRIMKECVTACKNAGIHYVLHPVGFTLLDVETRDTLNLIAGMCDLALILHDERSPDGQRLAGQNENIFKNAVKKIGDMTRVSFENATNTADVKWFWHEYAESITIDIGHVESSGMNSVDFIRSLDDSVIKKLQYVHMHRNNGLRGGITDHWPLKRDCREVKALRELLKSKSDVSVILELNETDEIEDSISILRRLQDMDITSE